MECEHFHHSMMYSLGLISESKSAPKSISSNVNEPLGVFCVLFMGTRGHYRDEVV